MSDLIDRQAAIDELHQYFADGFEEDRWWNSTHVLAALKQLPSAQPERLTDDDFETIRIHLSAHKEQLCNQRRWKEAEEYQRIIDRFMSFASAQPSYTDEEVQKMQELEQAEIEKAFQLGREEGRKEAQPERKGKWIKGGEQPYFRKHFDIVVCSICNKRGEHRWNFCPNCGADMRGEEHGKNG